MANTQDILNSIFPSFNDLFGINSAISGGYEDNLLFWFRNIILLVFVILVIIWIAMALIIGLRFITSIGDGDKFGEAVKSLKNLFIGVTLALLFALILYFITGIFWKPPCETGQRACRDSNDNLVCRSATQGSCSDFGLENF